MINPSAIFCSDRSEYYKYLSEADSGKREAILNWCQYVLSGLKSEIDKIDQLLDYAFLQKGILLPAVNYAIDRKMVTHDEFLVLKKAIEKQTIEAQDIKNIFPRKHPSNISHIIGKVER